MTMAGPKSLELMSEAGKLSGPRSDSGGGSQDGEDRLVAVP